LREKSLAGETILIIDDSVDVRTLLGERVLPARGYRTLTAPDGQEGLWQIRARRPDLIILDLRLPDMNGMELLHILSAEGYDMPVILLTAHGSEWIAAQALRLGVQDYIIKPFTLDEVLSSIERALTTRRLRRERNALNERLKCCRQALYLLQRSEAPSGSEEELGRLVEGAMEMAGARRGRLWLYEEREKALYVRVAWNGQERRAVLLRHREEHPQVEQALAQGTAQQWTEGSGEAGGVGLALPIFLAGRPGAVLEVLLPTETPPEEAGLALQALADRIGLSLEQGRLSREVAALRRRFEALAAFSGDALLVLDRAETIIAASPSIEALTGRPPAQVVGRDFRQWIRDLESPQGEVLEWYLHRSFQERAPERYALLFQGPLGEARQAEVEVLLNQKEGEEERHYLLFHETTAQARLEQEARSLRHLWGEVVRGARLGLLLTDLSGNVLALGAALSEVLPVPGEALLGRPVWEAFAGERHLLVEELARACRQGKGYVELPSPRAEAGRLGLTLLLLSGPEEKPQAIAILVGPVLAAEPGWEEQPR